MLRPVFFEMLVFNWPDGGVRHHHFSTVLQVLTSTCVNGAERQGFGFRLLSPLGLFKDKTIIESDPPLP